LRFLVSTLVGVFIIQTGLVQFFSNNFPYLGMLLFQGFTAIGLTNLLPALTQAFTIKTIAFALATVASLSWNFLLYKLWAFKEHA
jgi:hypothetical protein